MAEFVSVHSSGGLAAIRLSRPPVNALSIALQGELRDAAEQVSADPGFRVAGENAKFGVPEILLGVIPGLGGTPAAAQADRAGPGQEPHLHRTVRGR